MVLMIFSYTFMIYDRTPIPVTEQQRHKNPKPDYYRWQKYRRIEAGQERITSYKDHAFTKKSVEEVGSDPSRCEWRQICQS